MSLNIKLTCLLGWPFGQGVVVILLLLPKAGSGYNGGALSLQGVQNLSLGSGGVLKIKDLYLVYFLLRNSKCFSKFTNI